ncbi:MAG: hypothetical protein R6W75_12875 [Smithellaceae bacterium]
MGKLVNKVEILKRDFETPPASMNWREKLSITSKDESVQILIVGSGMLARELFENLKGGRIKSVISWAKRDEVWAGRRIVVHAGSGREMAQVVSFCADHRLVLVELSTRGSLDKINPSFPIVLCPNTNVLMLKFMAMIQSHGHLFSEYKKEVIESHQSNKKSEPGTAINIATSMGLSVSEIISVRDPQDQERRLGIPAEHLLRHAYHKIRITDGHVGIVLESKVLGHAPYASGLGKIIEAICDQNLSPGKHDVLELIQNGWL